MFCHVPPFLIQTEKVPFRVWWATAGFVLPMKTHPRHYETIKQLHNATWFTKRLRSKRGGGRGWVVGHTHNFQEETEVCALCGAKRHRSFPKTKVTYMLRIWMRCEGEKLLRVGAWAFACCTRMLKECLPRHTQTLNGTWRVFEWAARTHAHLVRHRQGTIWHQTGTHKGLMIQCKVYSVSIRRLIVRQLCRTSKLTVLVLQQALIISCRKLFSAQVQVKQL